MAEVLKIEPYGKKDNVFYYKAKVKNTKKVTAYRVLGNPEFEYKGEINGSASGERLSGIGLFTPNRKIIFDFDYLNVQPTIDDFVSYLGITQDEAKALAPALVLNKYRIQRPNDTPFSISLDGKENVLFQIDTSWSAGVWDYVEFDETGTYSMGFTSNTPIPNVLVYYGVYFDSVTFNLEVYVNDILNGVLRVEDGDIIENSLKKAGWDFYVFLKDPLEKFEIKLDVQSLGSDGYVEIDFFAVYYKVEAEKEESFEYQITPFGKWENFNINNSNMTDMEFKISKIKVDKGKFLGVEGDIFQSGWHMDIFKTPKLRKLAQIIFSNPGDWDFIFKDFFIAGEHAFNPIDSLQPLEDTGNRVTIFTRLSGVGGYQATWENVKNNLYYIEVEE